jgi:hypothetical protein
MTDAGARQQSRREVFLSGLEPGLSVGGAAAAVGVSRAGVYRWREHSPRFARQQDDAVQGGTDALEDEARRRTAARELMARHPTPSPPPAGPPDPQPAAAAPTPALPPDDPVPAAPTARPRPADAGGQRRPPPRKAPPVWAELVSRQNRD